MRCILSTFYLASVVCAITRPQIQQYRHNGSKRTCVTNRLRVVTLLTRVVSYRAIIRSVIGISVLRIGYLLLMLLTLQGCEHEK